MDDLTLTPEQQANKENLGRPLIEKAEFVADLGAAVAENAGYASGRLGMSQKHWMYYPILAGRSAANPKVLKLFENRLLFHGLTQEGVFPADPDFYLRYNEFYMEHVRNLDSIGLYLNPWDVALEKPIIDFYKLSNKLIYYTDQQPDRNINGGERLCYLPLFRGKKVLIVCPFASLLRDRAEQGIFEGVWSKIGKEWFYPGSVEALEFPYGFARTTHEKYGTALDLFDAIAAEIDVRDFDVALIGAGGLAIPIASHIKKMGRIGLDLGGHLQIIFGVIGQKWRDLESWQDAYYNDWWIDMPAAYKPEEDACFEYGKPGAFW
jgi:hypothetical protein